MTGGKTKTNFVKQIFICCLWSVSFWGKAECKLLLTFIQNTVYRVNSWFGGTAAFLNFLTSAVLNQAMEDLHPAVIVQLLLLPPPFHMSAAVLSLCLLTLPEHCKSFLLGLYTEATEAGDGWWFPLYSCIEHSNYPAFPPCLPVHHFF